MTILISKDALTMSSKEISDLTGKSHGNVMRDVRVMMDALEQDSSLNPVCRSTIYTGANGQRYDQYELDKDTCLTLLLGYDAAARMKVVKRWQKLEAKIGVSLPRPSTQAEMLLASAQALVSLEREQTKQRVDLLRIESRVEEVATAVSVLSSRPQNAEAISHIRPRIWQKYGIPAHIVDTVLRQLLYSPKPAGMVRNSRAEAEGSTYAVYWTKDVNAVFARFVQECERVTPAFVTHCEIAGRFRLSSCAGDASQ